jgi:hypothetical protein
MTANDSSTGVTVWSAPGPKPVRTVVWLGVPSTLASAAYTTSVPRLPAGSVSGCWKNPDVSTLPSPSSVSAATMRPSSVTSQLTARPSSWSRACR